MRAHVFGCAAAMGGVVGLLSSVSSAAIVATGGDAVLVSAPADARLNAYTSLTDARVWNEVQRTTLQTNILADAVNPGAYDSASDLSDVTITSGTAVNSHYIHFDSPAAQAASAEGFVTFDAVILGVIVRGDNAAFDRLDDSDFLGAPTLYSDGVNNRGLELGNDRFVISNDGLTIRFSFVITTPGDFIRVITAVPTPATGLLAFAGAAVLVRRRR